MSNYSIAEIEAMLLKHSTPTPTTLVEEIRAALKGQPVVPSHGDWALTIRIFADNSEEFVIETAGGFVVVERRSPQGEWQQVIHTEDFRPLCKEIAEKSTLRGIVAIILAHRSRTYADCIIDAYKRTRTLATTAARCVDGNVTVYYHM